MGDDCFLCTLTAGVEHQIGKHKMYRGSIDCVISKSVKFFNTQLTTHTPQTIIPVAFRKFSVKNSSYTVFGLLITMFWVCHKCKQRYQSAAR
jgi:hypothetical protein